MDLHPYPHTPTLPTPPTTQRSGHNALLDEGLLGTHMSLDNTLTKRCLTGRQRLLFVADVMQVSACEGAGAGGCDSRNGAEWPGLAEALWVIVAGAG